MGFGAHAVGQVARIVARPAVRLAREIPVHSKIACLGSAGPLVAFLPNDGRQGGAALLRCHMIADALRSMGWRSLVLPKSLTLHQRRRILHSVSADVVFMQGARHPMNRPEFFAEWPVVYDMDDADFHLQHLSRAVCTAMPQVAAVIAGSQYVAAWCKQAGAGEAHVVWTGAPVSSWSRTPHSQRQAIVAWAQTRPMTYVNEAEWVRTVVSELAAQHPGLILRLFDRQKGDDPGFAESFRAKGLTVEWFKAAKYSDYLTALDDVSLGLAPLSVEAPFVRGKSFGKVLSYLDRHVPVIASDACEHGAFFTPQTGIVSNDKDVWVHEAARLLRDTDARQTMADAAFKAFQHSLTSKVAAHKVDTILRSVLGI